MDRNHISEHETEQKFAEVMRFITKFSPLEADETSASVRQLARNFQVQSLLETLSLGVSPLTGEALCDYRSRSVQRSSTFG